MASMKENQQAVRDIMPVFLLDEFIDWISINLCPEDVFSVEMLDSWAKENDYKKTEE